jgi:hypothetical protein
MHNKQIEEALFPKDKIIHALQQEINSLKHDVILAGNRADKNETYANRYKGLRAIGVILAEEGTDPKYLKGEDMDAYFEGEQTAMQKLLIEKMAQTKHVLAAKILEKLYDARSQGQSKCDENT